MIGDGGRVVVPGQLSPSGRDQRPPESLVVGDTGEGLGIPVGIPGDEQLVAVAGVERLQTTSLSQAMQRDQGGAVSAAETRRSEERRVGK